MSDYKFLVATDMDYTLLMPGKPVSKKNKLAVKAIFDAGGCVTLATGRTFYLCGSYAADLGITVPLITSNGAAISDPVNFRDIESNDFSDEVLDYLMDLFTANNVDATGYSSDGIYFLENSSRRGFIESYNAGVPDSIKVPVLNDHSHRFNKFLLIDPDSSVIEKIKSHDDLQVVSSAKGFYDVMLKGTSKGLALKKIASMYNIPVTFALGDSENDLSLLESAGHSVAMGGSSIEQFADYVTTDCESDGFARAVYEFILPTVRRLV